jgi:hypothetical protein
MDTFLLLNEREPFKDELARYRVVMVTQDGRVHIEKDNLGLAPQVEGLRVATFLAVAESNGWEVERR